MFLRAYNSIQIASATILSSNVPVSCRLVCRTHEFEMLYLMTCEVLFVSCAISPVSYPSRKRVAFLYEI